MPAAVIAATESGLEYHVLDVFTEQRLAGNPLAVVLGADALDATRMQALAREFNLSETVFVSAPRAGDDFGVRIFTPAQELPFAGHPTIGTACLLADLGLLPAGEEVRVVLEEGVGPVPVRVRRREGGATHAQLSTAARPSFDAAPAPAVLAAALGLDEADLETDTDAPRVASCGVPYVLVPLRSLAALGRAQLRPPPAGPGQGLRAFYLYCATDTPRQWRARMFSAGLGIAEDPATGSAAAAFCGHLADRAGAVDASLSWSIRQGVEMGRPSLIEIEADKSGGAVTAVRVGGHAVRVATGRVFA